MRKVIREEKEMKNKKITAAQHPTMIKQRVEGWFECQRNQILKENYPDREQNQAIFNYFINHTHIFTKNMNKSKANTSKAMQSPALKCSPQGHPKKSVSPKRPNSPQDWATRYRELYQQYKIILEETKDRKHKYEMQQKQITRLRQQKQRDHQEINRLRAMLGFMKKSDQQTQYQMNDTDGDNIKAERNTFQTLKKSGFNLPSFTSTQNTNSPLRKRSGSPKYHRLRYNHSPSAQDLHRIEAETKKKSSEGQFFKKDAYKTYQGITSQQWGNQRFRTESLYQSDRYGQNLKKKEIQSTFYAFSAQQNKKQIKRGIYDEKKGDDSHRKAYESGMMKGCKLSNSPYSKLRFLKKNM